MHWRALSSRLSNAHFEWSLRVTAAPLIHQHCIYMCFQFIWSEAHDRTAVLNKCVVCVFDLVGSSFRMLAMLSFVQCVLIRSMKSCFFYFDGQVIDRSIYCYVEEYCAVLWSAPSVSVYFSWSCECAYVFASPYWGIRVSYESDDPRVIIALCLRTHFEINIYQIWYNLERKHNKMVYEWCSI